MLMNQENIDLEIKSFDSSSLYSLSCIQFPCSNLNHICVCSMSTLETKKIKMRYTANKKSYNTGFKVYFITHLKQGWKNFLVCS